MTTLFGGSYTKSQLGMCDDDTSTHPPQPPTCAVLMTTRRYPALDSSYDL